ALDDRTYGGRSFAKIVTRSPVRCAVIAAVKPSAPQPITATSRLPVAASRAFFTAISAAPHDSDHPLPPCPKLCTTTLLPTCSTSVLGPAARNGLRQTVVRKIRSTCARIGTIRPTASYNGSACTPPAAGALPRLPHPACAATPNPANTPDCC